MRTHPLLAAACSAVLFLSTHSPVQAIQATAPTTTAAQMQELKATVSAVTGQVQVRENDTQPWRAPKVGEVLPVGCECRTGPRSSITLTMPPTQVITLDRMTTVKILEAFMSSEKLKVDMGMRYGKVRYHIEAAGLEHEAIIRSPSSALAVRGSDVTKQDEAFTQSVTLNKGFVQISTRTGQHYSLGSSGNSERSFASPLVSQNDDTVAETANQNSAPPSSTTSSRSDDEQVVVTTRNNISPTQARIVAVHPSDANLGRVQEDVVSAKGILAFSLAWTGEGKAPVAPDLDLFIVTPRGDKLVPIDVPQVRASDGRLISKNDRGGAGVDVGLESVSWGRSYPVGKFQYGVQYHGLGDPGAFKVLVLQDGKQINNDFDSTIAHGDKKQTFSIDVVPRRGQSTNNASPAKAARGR